MATLLVFKGSTLVQSVLLEDRDLRIGRLPDNDVVLPDDGKSVSRYHAELLFESGAFVIHDLSSQNGTWVAASRVNRAPLASGQEAVIGPYRLLIVAENVEDADRPTAETLAATRPATRGSATAIPVAKGAAPQPAPARASAAAAPIAAVLFGNRTALYAMAGVATLVLVALVVWLGQAPSPEVVPPQAAGPTTPAPEPPPVDPEVEQLQEASRLVEIGSYDEAVVRFLEPLLLSNPAHAEAGLMWIRAQLALAPPPAPAPGVAPTPPQPPKPLEAGIPRMSVETDAAYLNRIDEARTQYDYAERLLAQSEWAEALRFFDRLAATYPEFRDVVAKAKFARDRIQDNVRAAMEAGGKLEAAGDFQSAIREYLRAKSFGADADGDIDRANTTARARARALMGKAKVFENYASDPKMRDEAVQMFRQIVALLPDGDPDRQYAEKSLLKLAP